MIHKMRREENEIQKIRGDDSEIEMEI